MRKASLVDAKAHLSELVDRAEHHGERILILRHGKPAAAIVPVEVAGEHGSSRKRRMTADEATAFLDAMIARRRANIDGLALLEEGRSRLDAPPAPSRRKRGR